MDAPSCPCIICQGREYRLKYDFGPTGIWRCAACGMMVLHPQPTESDLKAVYGDQYYRNEKFLTGANECLYGYVDYLSEKRTRRLDLDEVLRRVLRRLGTPAGERPSLLEVGCGLGLGLDAAHDHGFDVEGIEFNRYAYDYLKGKYVFPVQFGSVADAPCSRDSYDVCCMLDVIEHLLEPRKAVARIADLVRPGGLLVIQTMDSGSFASRLLGKHLEDFRRTREHLYFFDKRTIRRLLEEFGFDVVEVFSIGHSFELGFLLDRMDVVVPRVFGWLKRVIYPRWLLKTSIYFNPHTKMLVIARRRGGERARGKGY